MLTPRILQDIPDLPHKTSRKLSAQMGISLGSLIDLLILKYGPVLSWTPCTIDIGMRDLNRCCYVHTPIVRSKICMFSPTRNTDVCPRSFCVRALRMTNTPRRRTSAKCLEQCFPKKVPRSPWVLLDVAEGTYNNFSIRLKIPNILLNIEFCPAIGSTGVISVCHKLYVLWTVNMFIDKGKGKAVPLQAWSGPEGS